MQQGLLIPIDGRRIPGIPRRHAAEISRAARRVRHRTGCTGWWLIPKRQIIWIRGFDPGRGGPGKEVVYQGGRYLPVDVEATCRRLNFSKMSAAAKLRDVQRTEAYHREQRHLKAISAGRDIAEELQQRLKFDYRRITDGRHSRPVVTV